MASFSAKTQGASQQRLSRRETLPTSRIFQGLKHLLKQLRLKQLRRLNPLDGINWSEFRRAYSVFVENPAQGILHILAAQKNSTWQGWVVARLANQAAHLRSTPLEINIPELLTLPEHTLGGAYARHIVSQGFDPEAFRDQDRAQEHWVDQRAALCHDVHHVMTGFDGSPLGEFGLAAFMVVQYRDLLNVFVLSFAPYYVLGYPKQGLRLLRLLLKGFRMGLSSQPVFAYPVEANWQKPLSQVRAELGIG